MALKMEILNEKNETIDKLEPMETYEAPAALDVSANCSDNESSELWDKWMLTIYRELNQADRKKTA